MNSYRFNNNREKIIKLQNELRGFARVNEMEIKEDTGEQNKRDWVCHISKGGDGVLKSMTNTGIIIAVREMTKESVQVDIGKGKWTGKAIWGVVGGMTPAGVVTIPLSAFGAVKQGKLSMNITKLVKDIME